MAVAALIIAALYFGREIFVPVALSALLSLSWRLSSCVCIPGEFPARLRSWWWSSSDSRLYSVWAVDGVADNPTRRQTPRI